MSQKPKIAPGDLIARDFRELDGRTILGATWTMERALLEIAVTSHAHAGHGAFQGRKFVDTTEDHVARALGLDARAEKEQRQRWITDVRVYAEAAIHGRAPRFAVTPDGMPLFGIGLFRWLEVEPREVLIGLVLGGLRDNPTWRRTAQSEYGIEIGFGQSHPVNVEKLAAAGLNGEMLANRGHGDELDDFRADGIILPPDTPLGGDVQSVYVRYQEGPGASDDAAVLFAGKLYGIGAAVGCYLADAIDTLEKYTPVYADQDDEIAEMIRKEMPSLEVTDQMITHLTYLASTPPSMQSTLPDSTMRHFLERDLSVDQSILESHFLWLMGRPWKPMRMGHHPLMDNVGLYNYIEDRLAHEHTRPAD
jgi:hypothetical protein